MVQRLFRFAAVSLIASGLAASSPERPPDAGIDAHADVWTEVARALWETPELGYKETRSAARLQRELKAAGFSVQSGVADIPTAFIASFGSGRPVIGILAEYDALPGMSQCALPERKPVSPGGPGHACGHNLFAAGSALAAVAVRDWLAATGGKGTIRLYGCPAEEGGGGKVYLARAGVFGDCDAVLSWHPSDRNGARLESNLANISAKVRYRGTAAHASNAPEVGRSALDGVMLAAQAIEMLREHVPESTRMHYVITNGGLAPNVVPDYAEMYLYVRSPDAALLGDIWPRVRACADAGALASGTKVEIEIVNSNANRLPNDALAARFDRHLREIGGIIYTPAEQEFADRLRRTLPGTALSKPGSEREIQPPADGFTRGSTDVGDVSWVVPTAEFNVACWVPGTAAHTWQATACGGMSIGEKGMLLAARVLTRTAVDLFRDPALLTDVRASFERRRAGRDYRSFLPPDAKPPLGYRD